MPGLQRCRFNQIMSESKVIETLLLTGNRKVSYVIMSQATTGLIPMMKYESGSCENARVNECILK